MNALDVAKALFALSEKEQKSIFEFWQSMQQKEPKPVRVAKTKKKTTPQYTQRQYEIMQSEFQYAIDKRGSIDDKACRMLAKMLGRTLSAIKRAAWTYANDRPTWDKRFGKLLEINKSTKESKAEKRSGPIVFSALPIENKQN
jgi:hypothetical protein